MQDRYMISIKQIKQIFENSFDGLFVTDHSGKVIFINQTAAAQLKRTVPDTLGLNVRELVDMGVYDRSAALKAIETKHTVTMLVKTITGDNSISTSLPIIENGEVVMTITNVRSEKTLDSYIKDLEKEKETSNRYRSAASYLSGKKQMIIANSPRMNNIISTAQNIARTDCAVMILGESGTGKEVLSRFIHQNSPRSEEPFIPVNCAAIPNELIESEFLGYEKGAFTGANSSGKPGFFEMANKGTLFLDELGDMSLSMQSKLLRVLESGEVRRLGGTEPIKIDVRIITATNKNLFSLMEKELFREDLYYRVSVMPFHLPPLRERPEDIIELSMHFLDTYNRKYNANKYFSKQTLETLKTYRWPGNIRELKNVIERIFIIAPKDELELLDESFGPSFSENSNFNAEYAAAEYTDHPPLSDLKSYMRDRERQYILAALEQNEGRMGETAEKLGIHRTQLYKKIKQFESETNS